MLGMAKDSAKSFFAGTLFQDNAKVMRQLALGASLGVAAGVIVGLFAPYWLAGLVAGAVAGSAQPILFKDLKYA